MGGNPIGVPKSGIHENYFFVHNVYANFFKDVLDYFSIHLYPRFEHQVVATYDKAVEYLQKKRQYGRETDKPQLPAIVLNPSGEFEWADANTTAQQLWRFPNLQPGFIKRLFDPVYQDEHVLITPGFLRVKGTIEILMLLNSFYEYCDLRMLLMLVFGGFNRWIYPQYFDTFLILPEQLVNYEYNNEYTGVRYKLDWENSGAYRYLVKSTAKNELVLPVRIKPIFKLVSMSDNSDRYGGVDRLADWRLISSIEYELEIPAFIVLQSDYLVKSIDIEIRSGSAYSLTDTSVPFNRSLFKANYDWGLDETSNSVISLQYNCESYFVGDLVFKTRYYHIVTLEEENSETDVVFDLPETITNEKKLIIKYGMILLDYGDHFLIINDGTKLLIRKDRVYLKTGSVLELYVYEGVGE